MSCHIVNLTSSLRRTRRLYFIPRVNLWAQTRNVQPSILRASLQMAPVAVKILPKHTGYCGIPRHDTTLIFLIFRRCMTLRKSGVFVSGNTWVLASDPRWVTIPKTFFPQRAWLMRIRSRSLKFARRYWASVSHPKD